jgi:uncharacterized protein (TIGR02246 family)
MRTRTGRTAWIAVAGVVALSFVASAQKVDPDSQKLADQYQAAFNAGDAKGVGAFYTADATRLGPDGAMLKGRQAIEKSYVDGFAGPLKGAKLTLQQGATQVVTPDVKIMEGRYSTTGGGVPAKGRYVNTVVRQGGQWLLASVVTVPDVAPAK